MSSAIFTKRGLKTVHWNGEKGRDEIFLEKKPARHINHYTEIEEGVTLKNIMNVVANDPSLAAIVSVYSDVNDIDGFNKEVNKKATRDTELAYLEIYRSGQIHGKSLSTWTDWHGVRKRAKKNEGKVVGLSYTPLNQIAHLPVKLATDFKVYSYEQEEPLIDYITSFTLLDILHAIYYDISFHGGPKDRDKIKGEMAKTIDEILAKEFPSS